MWWYTYTLWKDSPHRVNEHIHHHHFTFAFLVRTFKFYSFSKFQLCNTVLSTLVTMFYIKSSDLIHLILKACVLLPSCPSLPGPQLLATTLLLCFYEFDFFFFPCFFRFHIQVIPCSVCLCLAYFIQHNALQFHPCCYGV